MANHPTASGASAPPTAARTETEPRPSEERVRGPRKSETPPTPGKGNGAGGNGAHGNGNGTGYGPGGSGPRFSGGGEGLPLPVAKVGLGVILGPMAILFSALVSAYVVRMGLGGWDSVAIQGYPSVWVSTMLLLLASGLLIRGARRTRAGALDGSRKDILLALAMGAAFLVSQATAWTALRDAGLFVATNPASSFIYLLTGLHGLHIVGGLVALGWVVLRRMPSVHAASSPGFAGAVAGAGGGTALNRASRAGVTDERNEPATTAVAVEAVGLYWHFLLVVWLVFFALMLVT